MATPNPTRRTAYRIAGYYALSFALASLLLGGGIWGFARRTLRQALDDRLQSELTTLRGAAEREGRTALIEDIVARDLVPGAGGYALIGRDGRRIAGKVDTGRPGWGLSDIRVRLADGTDIPGRSAALRLPNGETLAVIGEAESLGRIEHTLLAIAGAGFGLMIAIGVVGGFLIGHVIHRRLAAVDDAARAIMAGNLARRIPIGEGDDEFDRLSDTLNRMLDHIGQLMDSLRHVSADVAHDLRTPLSRLRVTLEAASDADEPAERERRIMEALDRVDGLMALFSTILRISEIERGAVRKRFTAVRLDLLAADLIETYAPAALDGERCITAAVEPHVTTSGDEGLIGQAIANLLENALKHTPEGTRIEVAVASVDGHPRLTVRDDGPGVPAEDHALVLRRFGRREASRSGDSYGLGLTLVAAVAATHRAELILADAQPGLSVTLVFPPEV
ncbi:HAMP domain-containing histidine kinase [Sphingomonas sp. AP4-R1]|uniref:sensor histidine kinase n=1 Tax=Sphingomonas sp. AP4-R1 TaxID=2735134 RepID=UPI0014932E5C|nr:HAMP domain-containing sensor histidine kinase [Sphingomonas sp. AP4-R1]QJU59082.1 HAMP domain-containing histidine kinase [Sphingomonas sp. AP4-R1]